MTSAQVSTTPDLATMLAMMQQQQGALIELVGRLQSGKPDIVYRHRSKVFEFEGDGYQGDVKM